MSDNVELTTNPDHAVLLCSCGSPEHGTIKVTLEPWDSWGHSCWVSFHAMTRTTSFWDRLVQAIRLMRQEYVHTDFMMNARGMRELGEWLVEQSKREDMQGPRVADKEAGE